MEVGAIQPTRVPKMYCTPSKRPIEDEPKESSIPLSSLHSNLSYESLAASGIFTPGTPVSGTMRAGIAPTSDYPKELLKEKRKLEHSLKMAKIELEKSKLEIEAMQTKHSNVISSLENRIKELEKERNFLFESAKKSKELLKEKEERIHILEEELEGENDDMTTANQLEESHEEKMRDMREQIAALQFNMKSLSQVAEQKINELNAAFTLKEEELQAKSLKISQLQEELEATKVQLDQAHIRQLSETRKELGEVEALTLRQTTFESVNKILGLEKELRKAQAECEKLRSKASSALINEERCRDLETKLVLHKDLEHRLAVLEAENRMLKDRRSSMASPVAPQCSSSSLARGIMEKTLQLTHMQEALSQLRVELKMKIEEIQSWKDRTESTEAKLKDKMVEKDQIESELLKSQEQLKLAKMQLEALQGQLKTMPNNIPNE